VEKLCQTKTTTTMHNIDRTNTEFEFNPELEGEYGHSQEWEGEGEGEGEGEFEALGEYEFEGEHEHEGEHESMELELASELLAVNNEQELEMFLGKLISRVAKGARNFARSSVGRSLISGLKGIAKKALPIVATGLGTAIGGPIGGRIAGQLGGMVSNLFELELEGLSNEDREFEIAKRFVRFANQAGRNAVAGAARGGSVPVVVNGAIRQAASLYAPGLLRRAGSRTGRWFRTANGDIVLRGAAY
jgi:uncharacterized protein (DUF697 family)